MAGNYSMIHRSSTNNISKIVFGVAFIAWIAIQVYAFSQGKLPDTIDRDRLHDIVSQIKANTLGIIVRTVICLVLVFGAFFVVRCASTLFTYIGIGIVYLQVVVQVLQILTAFQYFSLLKGIFSIVVCVVVIRGISQIRSSTIADTVENSCRATLYCPGISLIISIVFTCLILIIISLTGYTSVLLAGIHEAGKNVEALPVYLMILNSICGIWSFFVLCYYEYMLMTGIYATWYGAEAKSVLPSSEAVETMVAVAASHSGTACYGSSIVGMFRQLQTILLHDYDKSDRLDSQGDDLLASIVCRIHMILHLELFPCAPYTMTAMYGTDYYASVKRAYDIIIRRPLKYLVLVTVSINAVVVLPGAIAVIAAMTTFSGHFNELSKWFAGKGNLQEIMEHLIVPLVSSVVILVPVTIVLTPWVVALYTGILHSLNEDRKSLPTNVPH